jgi:tetratricopeptide (TPR) repeat protein
MSPPLSKVSKQDAELEEVVRDHKLGRLAEAEKTCRRILRARPSHSRANLLLGMILKDQGEAADAMTALRRVIAVDPNTIEAYNLIGAILYGQGKFDEAEAIFRQALARKPDMAESLNWLGGTLFAQGRFEESVPWFRRYTELAYGRGQTADNGREPVLAHKAKHDKEQREYLNAADSTAAIFHLEDGARVPGRAVNPDSSGGEIAARWQDGSSQIAVIDNFLSPEALDRLRKFCWGSTIWHRAYSLGYLGTVPELGFACPLLAQITDELRSTYPEILGDELLTRCWAFKYDSRLSGIGMHADFAAVNINFWITPDDANLDPESGGLVIWDKPAPMDWSFEQFNNPGEAVRDFLAKSGAKSVTVPHRANRAVVFNSDLFHKTDKIVFKEGYLNRRINITMLFGTREGGAHHDHDDE